MRQDRGQAVEILFVRRFDDVADAGGDGGIVEMMKEAVLDAYGRALNM